MVYESALDLSRVCDVQDEEVVDRFAPARPFLTR
jgi:hypothetical protein